MFSAHNLQIKEDVMDHNKLIGVIKEFPQVWDRSCVTFREQALKNDAWQKIGEITSHPAAICKDTFKSLREKYVREREKQIIFGEKYVPWQYLEHLMFLDPHIILRKQSLSYDEKIKVLPDTNRSLGEESLFSQIAENYSDFDKTLIALVKQAGPIWDRKSNGYPSKQIKYELWKGIAHAMNKDINMCMTRWKSLREKYIRQRNKYSEGEGKWEFLDNMSFLDRVIQYRRKNCETDVSAYRSPDSSLPYPNNFRDDSLHDSSSNELHSVKNEDYTDHHDNSYDSGVSYGRKRSNESPEDYMEKKEKLDISQKSPEIMFGELVAIMLARKPEIDRNIAMIEIMKVLTK